MSSATDAPSTDVSLATIAPTSNMTSTRSGSTAMSSSSGLPSSDSLNSDKSRNGLSAGARVGVDVGVAVAVLLSITVGVLVFFWNRMRQTERRLMAFHSEAERARSQDLSRVPLPTTTSFSTKPELDTSDSAVCELNTRRSVVELDVPRPV